MRRALLLAPLLLAPLLLALLAAAPARAAEIQVLTAGAFKSVLAALAPGYEAVSGDHLTLRNDTAGAVQQQVRAGTDADVVVLTPAGIDALGPLVTPGTMHPLARVGIGVAIRTGAPRPDISSPEAVRAAILAARAPAWIDPASGGSSGIAMARLFESWGIAGQLAGKAVLVQGGLVADALLDGRADLAFQQISELAGIPGITVLGPLPAAIQSYTTYAGAIPASAPHPEAAARLLDYLAGPAATRALAARFMDPP